MEVACLVQEALALRGSHPRAPAADVLDLVMRGRTPWLEDFFEHMEPPSPFALLVAEAFGDCMSTADWLNLTGSRVDPRVREALTQLYRESVWPKFVKRYGWSPPQTDSPEQSHRVRFF